MACRSVNSLEEWWADRRIHSAAPRDKRLFFFFLQDGIVYRAFFLAEAKSHKILFFYLLTNKNRMTIEGNGPEEQMWLEALTLTNRSAVTRWIVSRNIRGGVRSGSGQKDDLWIHAELLFYLLEKLFITDTLWWSQQTSHLPLSVVSSQDDPAGDLMRLQTKKKQIIHLGFRFQCSWNTCKSPRTNILSSQAKLISCFLKGKSSGGSSGPISSVLFHHFLKFLFYNQTEWMDGDKNKTEFYVCEWSEMRRRK